MDGIKIPLICNFNRDNDNKNLQVARLISPMGKVTSDGLS